MRLRYEPRPAGQDSRTRGPLTVLDLRKLTGHQVRGRPGASYCGQVLGAGWTETVALAAAFAVSAVATPAGISGAVLLLPFQVSVLGTPSPAVTPTNLLYNVVSTPGALYRYRRQHQTGGRLALLLITGTLPGVIAGSVIRVELVPGPRVFDLLVAALLLPLGIWLAATRPARDRDPAPAGPPDPGPRADLPGVPDRLCRRHLRDRRRLDPRAHLDRVRPPGLRSRPGRPGLHLRDLPRRRDHVHHLVHQRGPGGPELAHRHRAGHRRHRRGYTGARMQSRLPDILIRRVVGILAIAIAAQYLWSGLN